MNRLLLTVFTLFIFSALQAQSIYFEKVFGTPGSDFSRSVKQYPDGAIYLAGFSDAGPNGGYDASLCRLDRYGNLQWIKYFGDTLDNTCLYMNKCSDGSMVLVGEQLSPVTGLDVFVYKVDTSGNVIWQQTYGSPLNESCKYIEQTRDGGYILCGFKNDPYGSNDIYLLKIDSAGGVQWSQTYGGQDNEYSDMVHQLPGGQYILTADTKSMGAGGYDTYLLLLDSAGNPSWDFTYGDQFQNGCQGVLVTSSGKYLSYGETEIYQYSPFEFFVELIDTNGASVWRRTMGGTMADAAFSAVETPDKGFMLTGYSNSYSPGPISVVVLKVDSAGYFQWARQYGGEGIGIGYDIIPSIDNGYLITGKTYMNNSDEYYLLHVDQAGYAALSPEPAQETFSIYPNPSAGALNILLASPGTAVIKVFSIDGKPVHTAHCSGPDIQVRLDHLKPGIYIVEVASGTSITHKRVIISGHN